MLEDVKNQIIVEQPKEQQQAPQAETIKSENVSIFNNDSNNANGILLASEEEDNILFAEFAELESFIYGNSVSSIEETSEISNSESTYSIEGDEENVNADITSSDLTEMFVNSKDFEDIVKEIKSKLEEKTTLISNQKTIPYTEMSDYEVENVITNVEPEINWTKDTTEKILNGTDADLQALQTFVDEDYQNYQAELLALNEDMALELDNRVKNVEEKERIRDEKRLEILEQKELIDETAIRLRECELKYDIAAKKSEILNGLISDYEKIFNESLATNTQTTLSEEQKTLMVQIGYLKQQAEIVQKEMDEAEAAEKETRDEWRDAHSKLGELEVELSKAEDDVTTAEKEKEYYESLISTEYPDIIPAQSAYNEKKHQYNEIKETKYDEAEAYIDQLYETKFDAMLELNKRKLLKEEEEISYDDMLNKISSPEAKAAGSSIANSANNIVDGKTTSGGLCLAGVHKALINAYQKEWFGLPFNSAYVTAEALRGNVSSYEDIASHFVEIEVENPEDLENLPAGAIVVWDKDENHEHGHVSIAGGNGQEYSDFTCPQMTEYGKNYTVFIPIS